VELLYLIWGGTLNIFLDASGIKSVSDMKMPSKTHWKSTFYSTRSTQESNLLIIVLEMRTVYMTLWHWNLLWAQLLLRQWQILQSSSHQQTIRHPIMSCHLLLFTEQKQWLLMCKHVPGKPTILADELRPVHSTKNGNSIWSSNAVWHRTMSTNGACSQ